MELFAYILIISYLIYVIYGDSIYTRLLFKEKIKYPPVISQIFKRSVFISYISMLLIALFIINKTKFMWNLAFTFSAFSLIAYIIKHFGKKLQLPPRGNYYLSGIIAHILFTLPLFFYPNYFSFNININIIIILIVYVIVAQYLDIYNY
jgi:hypothetical protein